MPQIRLEKVGKDYFQEQSRQVFHAVQEVDLTIEQGEFVFITGSSGAGKTTLLQLLSCQMPPTSGAVFLDGVNVTALPLRQQERRRMIFGYVPQLSSLVRKKTIEENLLPVAVLGPGRSRGAGERIEKALGLVGMSKALHRYPVELSQGECRRVELARAILNNPQILALDELTANLDRKSVV